MNKKDIESIKTVVNGEPSLQPSKLGIILNLISFRIKTLFCIHKWEYEYSPYWNDNMRKCKKCGMCELQTNTTKNWK